MIGMEKIGAAIRELDVASEARIQALQVEWREGLIHKWTEWNRLNRVEREDVCGEAAALLFSHLHNGQSPRRRFSPCLFPCQMILFCSRQ